MNEVARGMLIAVEGADGAGTTTQCRRLEAWLVARGRVVHLTREPSTLPVGRLIRAVLGGDPPGFDPAALALLFAADRVDHLRREVEPAVRAGAVVLTDRYVMSSLVYQGLGVDHEFVATVNRLAPPPDLTLLVDVPAEVAAARRARRGGAPELFEADETQRRVIERYRREAEAAHERGERVVIVDGTPDEQTVFEALRDEVAMALDITMEREERA